MEQRRNWSYWTCFLMRCLIFWNRVSQLSGAWILCEAENIKGSEMPSFCFICSSHCPWKFYGVNSSIFSCLHISVPRPLCFDQRCRMQTKGQSCLTRGLTFPTLEVFLPYLHSKIFDRSHKSGHKRVTMVYFLKKCKQFRNPDFYPDDVCKRNLPRCLWRIVRILAHGLGHIMRCFISRLVGN